MMSNRLRRAYRVLAVQSQLERLALWQLIDLESQAASLEERQRDLINFMQHESAFSGLFSSAMMRRLQALAELHVKAKAENETQRTRHLEERGRLRRVGRIVTALEIDTRRQKALRELIEAIETAEQRRHKAPASSLRHHAEDGF
jgi:hypothetical protein